MNWREYRWLLGATYRKYQIIIYQLNQTLLYKLKVYVRDIGIYNYKKNNKIYV